MDTRLAVLTYWEEPSPWVVETRLEVVTRTEPLIETLVPLILPFTSSIYDGELQLTPTRPLELIIMARINVEGGFPFIGHIPLFSAISTWKPPAERTLTESGPGKPSGLPALNRINSEVSGPTV